MIPKVIHYCWFGHNPKPKLAKKCFHSWKKHCPDYSIVEWNEENYDLSAAPLYVRQAYEAKKWAFVTDYVRLHVVHDHGGIYLDTDVELRKSLDGFLGSSAFFGFEDGVHIATGLGFGAEKGAPILKAIMADYQNISFLREDGSFDDTPCPVRNTGAFLKLGLRQDDSYQTLDGDILILPSCYLSPKDWKSGIISLTEQTHSIHHCGASWYSPEMRKQLKARQRKEWMSHLPSRIGHRLLGEETYEKIRSRLRR